MGPAALRARTFFFNKRRMRKDELRLTASRFERPQDISAAGGNKLKRILVLREKPCGLSLVFYMRTVVLCSLYEQGEE